MITEDRIVRHDAGMEPPVAPRRAAADSTDPYAWMRDTSDPALLDYLAAERAYYDQQTAHTASLRDELAAEMSARLAPAEESAGWELGGWHYFTRTLPGLNYEQFCRRPRPGSGDVQVLLDENLLVGDGGYVALGVREVSPDGRLLAYSADFDGDEVYQLRIRDLATGTDRPERIERSYYGLAWSADSRSVLYTVTDPIYRPYQVWRHDVGTGSETDVCVFTEPDERFEVTVRASRSGALIFVECESRDTTETLVIPAEDTRSVPRVLEPRRRGIEYRADHADGPDGGELYLVTNDGATEFRLVKAPVAAPGADGWSEVVPESADTRLVSCDVFSRYLVLTERRGAATQLRVLDRDAGAQRLTQPASPHTSLELADNYDYQATSVTVRTESLITPPAWHDVDLAGGEWQLRKRQQVPGYDPARYRTARFAVPAADGTAIPVTVAFRAGFRRDGTAPCLLYGYGAYEACSWPEFELPAVSLLDRGYVYAVAHIRGGGEGGRRWWLDGRLDRKKNTFTDFIAVADALAADGWAAPDAIVSRGLSAGGLLQGAVFAMAPQRWRAVVAEVPFVDCLTTMLDPGIPLTAGEWDEWGDPRDPAARAYLASYSPYDNVPDGVRPSLLVTGSLHDPRVLIHEPAKWVARLRATAAPGGRLLFRPELGAGAHVGPAGRYDHLRYEAEVLAFILDEAPGGVSLSLFCVQNEEQEAQEARLLRELVGEQLAGFRHRVRFADDGDAEAGRGEGVGHRVQRPVPEAHRDGLAAHRPVLGPVVGREIVDLLPGLALEADDGEGMVDRRDQPAAGPQHAPQLGKRWPPVFQVVQDQGGDDIVERGVGVRQRAVQLGHPQVRVVTEPPTGLLQHPGARVEAGHDGAPVAQRREMQARAAAGVENPPASYISGEGQGRGSLVVGIEEAGLVGGRVPLGQGVIVVDPGRLRGQGAISGFGRHAVHAGIGAGARTPGIRYPPGGQR
jgi:oligopeptidase B